MVSIDIDIGEKLFKTLVKDGGRKLSRTINKTTFKPSERLMEEN